MVATIGAAPALTAVNADILPDPLAARPIEAPALLVQLYMMDPPVVGLLNVIAVVLDPLQTV